LRGSGCPVKRLEEKLSQSFIIIDQPEYSKVDPLNLDNSTAVAIAVVDNDFRNGTVSFCIKD
jgi:hypothetical protein